MSKIRNVFYADDDADDIAWVKEARQAVNSSLTLTFFDNGRQVLDHLQDHYPNLPDLIVLDLNMPELDGKQTLQRLKASPQFSHIPVVIVTTSSTRLDQQVCQRLGAALFLTKPDSQDRWQQIIKEIEGVRN